MTQKRILLVVFLGMFFLASATGSADEIPSPPHRFKGFAVNQTGEFVPDGTIVSAHVNNVFYNTTVKNGTYGFPLETETFYVYGTESDEIFFYINGTPTLQSTFFVTGGLNVNFQPYLNLSLDTSPLTITSVTTTAVSMSQATISWVTNKPANATMQYGVTTALGSSQHDGLFVKSHSITLLNLNPGTQYYYEVFSYDYSGHVAQENNGGLYYQFTTLEESSGGNGGGNGGGLPPGPGDVNLKPVADANGPYYGLVNQLIMCDGSSSYDTDGYLVNYTWEFGDGTSVTTPQVYATHTYALVGNYTIVLTVTDNKGATNTTTTIAYISTDDTDGDGWSDDAERYYGTDPYNESVYPVDSDGDGLPDSIDPDDDNDSLSDAEEVTLGSDPHNASDVLRVLNSFGLFYLIDTTGDGLLDTYYNQTQGFTTLLCDVGNGTYLIDSNDDAIYDFQYVLSTGSITPYSSSDTEPPFSLVMMMLLVGFMVVIVFVLFLALYVRVRKKETSRGDSHEKK